MAKFELRNECSDYTTKTFRLPTEIIDRLSKKADEQNLSLNKAVIQCLEYALEAMETDD